MKQGRRAIEATIEICPCGAGRVSLDPYERALILATVLPARVAEAPVKIVGDLHKLVLFSDGTVGGWGHSRDGQTGPRSAIPNVRGHAMAYVPIAVPRRVLDIAAGGRSSYLLLDDGTVAAFGCGEPCLNGSETPVPVIGLRDVVSLAARESTVFAIIAMSASVLGAIEKTARRFASPMYRR